jgi:hypothetical protein
MTSERLNLWIGNSAWRPEEFFLYVLAGFVAQLIDGAPAAHPRRIGAALGAYALSYFPGDAMRPYIATYLLLMGAIIIGKACRAIFRRGRSWCWSVCW